MQLIKSAKQRIYLTALYFEKDEAGQEILAALYQAKQANPQLEIKILVDWHRAQRGRIGEEESLSNADWYVNVKAEYNLPAEQEIAFYGVPINTREIFGVLHLKGFVFDDPLALFRYGKNQRIFNRLWRHVGDDFSIRLDA